MIHQTHAVPVRFARARAAPALMLPLGLAIASAPPVAAQRITTALDVGGAGVWYADSVRGSAMTISPGVTASWERATLSAGGVVSELGSGAWTTQGAVALSAFTPAAGVLVGELSGVTGGSAHADGSRTGRSVALGRVHLMGARAGAWGAAGIGAMWDGALWRSVRLSELGTWTRLGASGIALATVTPTVVDDTIRYVDSEMAVRLEGGRAELGASAGVRSGSRLPVNGGSATAWGSASLTAWLSPSVGVLASAGSYPVDFTQGFPGGRFVSIGVRFGTRRSRDDNERWATRDGSETGKAPAAPAAPAAPGMPTIRGTTEFQLVKSVASGATVRIHAPGAASVEIIGDFTDWQPMRLSPARGDWWSITMPIEPGSYQVNVRLDGGPWRVPPGLVVMHDEFEGEVGLVTVP